jgi:hypothetical protein
MTKKPTEQQVIWTPMPGPQTLLVSCPVFEVFYGGARGGGKTEGSIGDWLLHSNTYGKAANGVFFRREQKQLEEVIARTHEIFPIIGAKWQDQKATWTMPGGARLKFRYLERDRDAEGYQGHSYTRVYIEELTNFPSPSPINKLRATLRSAKGVPVGMRATGNPGGPGHTWVKKRYISPDKRGWKIIPEEFRTPNGNLVTLERVFIPSRVTDNTLLEAQDPTYVARLMQSGTPELVRAWLEGDWDLVLGAFFDCFNPLKHVLRAAEWLPRIPKHSMIYRSMDWGSAKPFSVGWYAVSDGKWGLPRGALVKVGEWYGSTGEPNVGLKMTADAVARGIMARERRLGWDVNYGVADPAIFIRNGGPSIAESMAAEGCFWRPADNKRIPGWEALRQRLVGLNGVPLLYFLDSCEDTIRTLPQLQHDETHLEDVDTDGEDHAGDETRYACMAKPWIVDETVPWEETFPKLPSEMTINELLARATARRLERTGEEA